MGSYPHMSAMRCGFCLGVSAGLVFAGGYIAMVAVGSQKSGSLQGGLIGAGAAGLFATVVYLSVLIAGCCGLRCGDDCPRSSAIGLLVLSVVAAIGSFVCVVVGAVHGLHDAFGTGMVAGGALLLGHALLVIVVLGGIWLCSSLRK